MATWQTTYLQSAGLPANKNTAAFLTDWGDEANSGCEFNAIDISHAVTGSSNCSLLPNGKHAQTYKSTSSAANAFAYQLTLSAYPNLRKALASGDPYAYGNVSGVSLDLQKWGSTKFQQTYLKQEGVGGGSGGSGGGSTSGPSTTSVQKAWTRFMRGLAHNMTSAVTELDKATARLNRLARTR